jgi:hypothetical protein
MDYDDKKTKVNLDRFEDVVRLSIKVVTGDEILEVLYKNYDIEEYDSSDCRLTDYFDGEYCIYDIIKDINIIEQWNNRKDSYEYI